MGIISRKPITISVRARTAIALAVAAVLTLTAFLLTRDGSGPVGGKAALIGVILVLPLVLGAKSGWSTGASFAFAFLTYFSVCLGAVWFVTRQKRTDPAR